MKTINNIIYLTPKEVADKLGVHINTILRYIRENKLKAFTPTKKITLITEQDIEDFIKK